MPLNILKQFATEVKIPINECFISLSFPTEVFGQAQREASPELQAQARELDAQIASTNQAIQGLEQTLRAMGLPFDRPTGNQVGDAEFGGLSSLRGPADAVKQPR